MKKNTTKSLVMSILTLALALSLVAGGSFALFTSESKMNIAVTSGKVDVIATVDDVTLSSTLGTALGSAEINGNELFLENFAPGDKATFNINLDNQSNIAILFRTFVKVVEDDGLFEALIIEIDDQEFNGFTAVSNWQNASNLAGMIEVSIELPEGSGNEYQGKTTKLAYTVEAVQGNAVKVDASPSEVHLYTAFDLLHLATLVNEESKNQNGKTVRLMNDIDMKAVEMSPIGSIENMSVEFAGTFDGQNHTIKNINIVGENDYGTGLFGSKGEQSTAIIKNFTLDGGSVIGTKNVGAVMGMAYKATIENITVKNITIEQTGEKRAAGIIANPVGVLTFVRNNKVENVTIIGTVEVSEIVSNTANGVVMENNTHTNVTLTTRLNVVVSTDLALKNALFHNAQYITVTLDQDLSLDVSDAHIKLGSLETREIEIIGNGHLLTLSTTYWSRLNTKNTEAVLILRDIDVTSTQPSGTWNSYDITFLSKVELEDVNFLKAVALSNDAVMHNVTITESNNYYALWITADGQTIDIDGLVINAVNGRAIAIKDEYTDKQLVTLSISNAEFNSKFKAAILVTSEGGANITLENIDISNVEADSTHHVWVDSERAAWYDLVEVNSGTLKFQEA